MGWTFERFQSAYLGGSQVRIITPPPADPVMKASRFLSQSFTTPWISNEISPEDHLLINVAETLSQQMIYMSSDIYKMDEGSPILYNTQVPVYEPWHEASREALWEEGISPTGELWNAMIGTSKDPEYSTAYYYLRLFNVPV